MIVKKIYILFFFLVVLNLQALAQAGQRSEVIKWQNGQRFYVHTVAKSQGLYAIQKIYNVTESDILEHNPEAIDGLKENQELLIPYRKPLSEEQKAEKLPYRIHQIKANETIYSISKLYKISQELIFEMNPETKQGYKINQKIKIPLEEDIQPIEVQSREGKRYKVRRKDTLYALAKKLDCTEEDILTLNPEVRAEGLKRGQRILIPKKEVILKEALYVPIDSIYYDEPLVIDNETVACDSAIQRYHPMEVALMLPFELDKRAFDLELESTVSDMPKFKVKPFLEFYQGTLLALKQLKKEGYKLNLHVFNTLKDSLPIERILKQPVFDRVELIIGPVYANSFAKVQQFADAHKIPIINPIMRGSNKANYSEYTIDVFPDKETEIQQMVRYVLQNDTSQLILIYSGYLEDRMIVNSFKSKYHKALYEKTHNPALVEEKTHYTSDSVGVVNVTSIRTDICINCKELVLDDSKNVELKGVLNPNKTNLVVIGSDNQALVSNVFTQLNLLYPDYKIQVLGREKWRKFDNIDIRYLHHLDLMQLTSESVDYNQWSIQKITEASHSYFNVEPSKYTFYGYDLFYNFSKYFYRWNSLECLPYFKFTAYILGYDLVKSPKGWINKNMFIEHYGKNIQINRAYQLKHNKILQF